MSSAYKAIKYEVTIHHDAVNNSNEPWNNMPAYDTHEIRYCIVSEETGEILDDAQGYGYKSAQKAYSAYAYKTRDKSKDKERNEKIKHIKKWMKENKSFIALMDECSFQIAKGTMAPDDKFNTKFVKNLLEENDLHPDFSAHELLKVWRKS